MRLLVALCAFLCIGTIGTLGLLVPSRNVQRPLTKSTAAASCSSSKWNDFSSFIGEMVIQKVALAMNESSSACLTMNPSMDFLMKFAKCAITSLKSMQGDNMEKIPNTNDVKSWYERAMNCEIDALQITRNGKGLDVESATNKLLLEIFGKHEEDKASLSELKDKCLKSVTGSSATEQVINIEKCIAKEAIEMCEKKGLKAAVELRGFKAFLTIWDEGRCAEIRLNNQLNEAIDTCLSDSRRKWEANGYSKFGTPEMMVYKNDVKDAMNFLMKFGEGLIGLSDCTKQKLGLFNSSTGMLNTTATRNMLNNLKGWRENEKIEVLTAFDDCVIRQNETLLMQMGETERQHELFKEQMLFFKCFAPQFIDICGINNELAKFFFPFLNSDLIGKIYGEFKEKKGHMAAMNLIPVFREKFDDVFNLMKNKY